MGRFSTSLLGEAKTLLLATDGSRFSEGAIQEAIFFGQACQARVVILHIVPTQAESIRSANFAVRQGQQELAPQLEYIRKLARDSGVQVELAVVGSSRPEKTIVEQARLRQADVILMGRRNDSSRLARLTGRMTARVIGQGFPRVLVAPEDFIITGRHLLLVVADSENGRLAAREALSLGQSCDTLERLSLLLVAGSAEKMAETRSLVDELLARCTALGPSINCQALFSTGDPASEIVATARAEQVDMVLIGSSAGKSMAKMFQGRVSAKVAAKAHCAVLVVSA